MLARVLRFLPGCLGSFGIEHFFGTLQQDPLLAEVKLIAEPWDLGPDGYRSGAFPGGWGELSLSVSRS